MTQAQALDILKTGRSAFLTGAAGSGKTHVLREYIKYLNEHDVPVGITASTGIAATHMGGMTIHAWSGIGVRATLSESDLETIITKQYLKTRFDRVQVLIIDEISMLHHFRLDLVDQVLRRAKLKDEPFGGIQVVFCGDFFQLPPVVRQGETPSLFSYMAQSWKELNPAILYLHESHRQDDGPFLRVLHAIRDGEVEEGIGEVLMERLNAPVEGGIEPTKLYTHNKDVDTENDREIDQIPGEAIEFYMEERGRDALVLALKKGCLAPEVLRLKPGAKVMFVKNNFEAGYANGTLAVVEKCSQDNIVVRTKDGKEIVVELDSWAVEENGKLLAEISQYPLRLAWAITIHKSQGMSLDAAEIDLSKSFERGMGYVALSRVRTLGGLSIKGMNNMALAIHEEALEMDREFKKASDEAVSDLEEMGGKKLREAQEAFVSRGKKPKKVDTVEATKELLLEGKSIAEIAAKRELTEGTIIDHLEKIKAKEPQISMYHLRDTVPVSRFKKIMSAFQQVGTTDGGQRPLSPVMSLLGKGYEFDELRIVRLFL
ncbi:MAG TPA: helix-turn-helix domain-containing protein [Candidatus Paceibacterota bacterium]|jgi:ATP-dependent exoDNAse (exonuclease V), alpha subunit - helicase superfamily I member